MPQSTVVIVGGGASGLSAAGALQQRGIKAVILEEDFAYETGKSRKSLTGTDTVSCHDKAWVVENVSAGHDEVLISGLTSASGNSLPSPRGMVCAA